jgi:hypothetical protein
MADHSLEIRTAPQAQVERLESDIDDLNRPERVVPGSAVQARIAAAVIGRLDEPTDKSFELESVLNAAGSNRDDFQPNHVQVHQGAISDSGLEQRREAESSAQAAQREALVERTRQEVSQNVEQLRVDIVRGTQGRSIAETLGGATVGEILSHSPSVAIEMAPSQMGKIGASLPEVREQTLDRIARVQEQLYILSAARTTQAEGTAQIQGRGDFRGNAELRHDAKPENVVVRADRSATSSPSRTESSVAWGRPSEPSWYRTAPDSSVARVVEKPIPAPVVERANRSLDVVSRFVRTASDNQLAARLLWGVDTLCYTLFGVVAVGALAGDRATRFTYRTLRQLLAEMRKRSTEGDIEQEERTLVDESSRELAHALVDFSKEIDRVSASTVADVCGSIVDAETAQPIIGVVVSGGQLGQAITDERGVFLFRNISIHTPYELTPMHSKYEFAPRRIVGLCVELNFERFVASKRKN